MAKGHAVVDGSNIATEGRTEPSLKQLREAIAEFEAENDFKHMTVIVDASFEHRVSAREKRAARAAIDAGEMITPPAGVVGRGDAFILEVADRAGAIVLSNDSFQEFHGTYPWLFDEGRLIGGKPVPGVGWVYVPRTPVRGPVSRRATKKATRPTTAKKATKKQTAPTTKKAARSTKRAATPAKKAAPPPDPPPATKTTPARRTQTDDPGTNTVATWRAFRRAHPIGSTVTATVESYSSHGAYGTADGAVVYFPNRTLGDPPPNRARDVLSVDETREFVVQAYDEERRGIDLGLVAAPGEDAPQAGKGTSKKKATGTKASEKAAKKTTKKTTEKTTTKKATKRTSKRAPKRTTTRTRSVGFDNTTKG